METRLALNKELLELPGKIQNQEKLIDDCKCDIYIYTNWKKENPPADDKEGKKKEQEDRRQLRDMMGSAVRQYVMETEEKILVNYRGFDIILPANMMPQKPYVWLKGTGKYYVELGDKDVGNLIRIDNYMEGLNDHLEKLKNGLKQYKERKRDIEIELEKDENYADEIEKIKRKLERIDKKLGVDKK